jgi:hypothetical protein
VFKLIKNNGVQILLNCIKRIFLSSKYSTKYLCKTQKIWTEYICAKSKGKKKCKAHLLKKFNILAQCKNQSRKDGVAEMPIPIWPTVMPCMAVPVVKFPTWELVLIFCNSNYILFACHKCSIKLHKVSCIYHR